MVRKTLLSASVALLVSQSVSAACFGDLEMHGSRITELAGSVVMDETGNAANKTYVDNYIAKLDENRRNGTMVSQEHSSGTWYEAQNYCNELISSAVMPDGTSTESPSESSYDDWHLPSREEWLSVCLHQDSKLDYTEKTWVPNGLCSEKTSDDNGFWTSNYHLTTPIGWVEDEPWHEVSPYLDKYDILVLGSPETFDPSTGASMRIRPMLNRDIRCVR